MKPYVSLLVTVFLLLVNSLLAQPVSFAPKGVGGGGALFFPSINPANDNEFYVACDMGEMFHSTDFGLSYSQIHFSKVRTSGIGTMGFTSNPLIAYCISNDGNMSFPLKTTDGGNTWTELPGFMPGLGDLYSLKTDFSNPNILVIGQYGDITISLDGGTSFTLVKHAADMGAGIILGGIFFDLNAIYIGTNEGILVSNDNGVSFTVMPSTGITAGEVIWSFAAARDGATLRFATLTGNPGDTYNGLMPWDYWGYAKGVYVMDNANGTWIPRNNGINFSNDYLMYVGMAGNDVNTIYLGGSDASLSAPLVMKSTNDGQNWTKVFNSANNQNIITGWSGVGGDKNWSWGETCFGISVAPNNKDKVMFGDFGFVHVTDNGGASWRQAYVSPADQHPAGSATPPHQAYHSIGLENTTCWQVSWQSATKMMSAYSDIGAIRSEDAGNTWGFNYSGMSVNTVYRITSATDGKLFAACSNIHDLYQSTRLRDAQLDAADGNGKIMFSSDEGESWSQVHNFGHPVFWIAIDPNNANKMYAAVVHYGGGGAAMQGGIWVTNNLSALGASTWTQLPAPPRTEGHPAFIQVLNDGKVLCSFSGRINSSSAFTASSGVFMYDPLTTTWTDFSDPNQYYWCKDIVIDPTDPTQDTWHCGVFSGWGGAPNGKGGLYKTTNRGLSWTKLTGPQFDRVTSITFNPLNAHQAYLTTEGQGLWYSSDMQNSIPVWNIVEAYPFQQPERVFYNPYNLNEIWVSSFGNGMKVGNVVNIGIGDNPPINSGFAVSPNPCKDYLTIRTSSGNKNDWIEIFNIQGQLVFKSILIGKACTISIADWEDGLYFIKCGYETRKFAKIQE